MLSQIIFFITLSLICLSGVLTTDDILSDPDCLKCLCRVSSNSTDCTEETCKPDVTATNSGIIATGKKSCGAFHLNLEYFVLCGSPEKQSNEDESTAFQRCATDSDCSKKCIKNYTQKYEGKCPGQPSCEMWTKIHFGGRNGCRGSRYNDQWNKVKSCLDRKDTL